MEIELICLPADCDSSLKDSEAALIAIAHAVDNIGAAFGDDMGKAIPGLAGASLERLADAAIRIARALEILTETITDRRPLV